MKKISSRDEDLKLNVSLTLGEKVSSLKVRRSLAILGFALSAGTVGVLVNQQSSNNNLKATPVAASSRTLTDVMSQNQDRKYEMARTAIASGAWDVAQGVTVHEVREDETLWKLTQVYQVDAAAIAASNNISANTELQPGTKLVIPPVNGLVHKVKAGDTLEAISDYYKVPKSEIIKFTSLNSGDFLAIDQPLVIPGNVATLMQVKDDHVKRQLLAERERLAKRLQELEGKKPVATLATSKTGQSDSNAIAKQPKQISYRVQNGDTIETIARRYGITQKAIIEANKLENPQWLELDQELKLPQERSLPNIRTIASSNEKPSKNVPAPVIESSASAISESRQTPQEATQVRVIAATPMVLPKAVVSKINATNRVSPWDGLRQITGADSGTSASSTGTTIIGSISSPSQSNPMAVREPVIKVAAALLPFIPDQMFGELGGAINSTMSPTAINLPARSIAAPTVPAATATEQITPNRSIPLEANSSQPVAEPRVNLPEKIAAVLSVPQITEATISEQTISRTLPTEAVNQPAGESDVKNNQVAAIATPRIPASAVTEQSASAAPEPVSVSPQPESEPVVKVPTTVAAASLAARIPASASVEVPSSGNAKPNQVALLVEPESRMTSLEVRKLESEVNELNTKVRDAEIREAARKAEEARKLEAAKIAAANLNGNSNRSFDGSIVGVSPELPQLTANAYLPDVQDYGLSTGFIWPADGVFTSGFGWRWGRVHQGIDIAAPIGTPILAAASGVVEYSSWNDGGYGNMIDIRHSDGTITRYAHMNALYVKAGQTVSQGQTIGEMGSTGFSTGPHLHFEIRPNGGGAINPMVFLAKADR